MLSVQLQAHFLPQNIISKFIKFDQQFSIQLKRRIKKAIIMRLGLRLCFGVIDCLNAFQGKVIDRVVSGIPYSQQCIIKGKLMIQHSYGEPAPPALAISVQLFSSSEIDPNTGKGKLSEKARLKLGKSRKNKLNESKTVAYELEFNVDADFGIPGAFVIKNQHKLKFLLESVTLEVPNDQTVHFECNSWVYPIHLTNKVRLFFSNNCYLPNETPNGLVELRKEELISLRGDGTGERREWDRIYDYDYYDDLGDPSKGPNHERPTLGASYMHPYPRRGRTGRPASKHGNLFSDFQTENLRGLLDVFVPPDERMSPRKQSELIANTIEAAAHFVIPEAKAMFMEESSHVQSFAEINALFTRERSQAEGERVVKKLKGLVPDDVFRIIKRSIKKSSTKFPLPQIVQGNEFAWKDDQEFGRQMLAGINPNVIQCLQCFPPKSIHGVESSIKSSHIENNLDGLTLEEAMNQRRIFILDHHDYLMPFLDRINTDGVCAYASRTLLFLKHDATLKPLAIELSLPDYSPDEEINWVFCPAADGTEAALWQLAKTHVAVNDSGYHQIINHWLNAHATVEPFIIATRRHLSAMHPIHRLLDPHFKDTMHINALARNMVISSEGVLEKILFTGRISMELSSTLYKDWRFDEQGLPADLIKRGMALYNADKPAGVQLLFEDYPYGVDGLEIWVTIKRWVADFCSYFYKHDDSLTLDNEVQEWWSEIRYVGHGDKINETWYSMTNLSDLVEALTTLIWIITGFHAAVNSELYAYAGYPPNRPTLCRNFIPEEGTTEFAMFLKDPDIYYLKMLPDRLQMALTIAFVDVLSRKASNEVYLGQQQLSSWIGDQWIEQRLKRFSDELNEVRKRIKKRNRDPKFKNRGGPAKIPYEFLYPGRSDTGHGGGLTGEGILPSVAI